MLCYEQSGSTFRGHLQVIDEGNHTAAVHLRCTFMIRGELKRPDAVEAHTERKAATWM